MIVRHQARVCGFRAPTDNSIGTAEQATAALPPGSHGARTPCSQDRLHAELGSYGCARAPWRAACLWGPEAPCCQDASLEPLPAQPPAPPLLAPLASPCLESALVSTRAGSTDLGRHAPAEALCPASLASLVQGILGPTTRSQAIGAVGEGRRGDGFQQQRYRSLAPLGLARRLADRTLPSLVLCAPEPCHREGRGAPTGPAFREGVARRGKERGIRLRRHPVDPRSARLPRPAIRLPQAGAVDPVGARTAWAAIRWSLGVTVGDRMVSPVGRSRGT
jgi:hypothetical protein